MVNSPLSESLFGILRVSRPYKSLAHLEQSHAPSEKAQQELRKSDVPEAVVDLSCKAFEKG